jgi:Zn ribbon nucleic-acid-binding protein
MQAHSLGRNDSADATVRCPYCVLGDEFRPMLSDEDGQFTCAKCRHTARPADKNYSCRCYKCRDLIGLTIDSGRLQNRPTTSLLNHRADKVG